VISFKMSRLYFLVELSLHNFFLNVSSVVDIIKIIFKKKKQKGKNQKMNIYTLHSLKMKDEVENYKQKNLHKKICKRKI
jgi:hypothetical protein